MGIDARRERKIYMKKDDETRRDDALHEEYDRDDLKGGIRGKYLERYNKGTNLAKLAPDVRAAFPSDESVNKTLRSLMQEST
jgi:hypothetical protein